MSMNHNRGGIIAMTTGGFMNTDETETAFTLSARDYKDAQCVAYGISSFDSNAMKSSNPNSGIYEADTTRTLDLNGGNPACNQGGMAIVQGINGDKTGTLDASYYKGCGMREGKERDVVMQSDGNQHYIVRRLTPLECERLQGFPDGWTDIGKWIDDKGKERDSTDSARYKALGNSISIPNWFYVLQKLTLVCGLDNKMASLFDGIGGFPLIWEGLNGEGSCVWASEIEGFPIAVTQRHFPDGATPMEE